ncbi:hypothetical protein DAERI_010337 [Deinococcus aerius]|uniref:Uncharacterized protein n=1 Tax=Deinococcus aerius TaxID=200253 RepID=A0A2I9DUV2_9DEIO|nr:hypothetical protein [Deinococcus aerius]GBF04165.1 hypothetical protein DAERI_010337 [Deinococcus aerius]
MTGPKRGSRGRAPKRNTAQGRGGITRDSTRPARERTPSREEGRPAESRPKREEGRTGVRAGATNPARRKPGERDDRGGERPFKPGPARQAPPKPAKKKPLPELKRVQLDAPPPDATFRDRDGETVTFPDSALKRVAARILTGKNKAWRYRPFSFPLFTDKGNEQAFHFDFYIYDAEDSVIRLILVVPFESREVWDRVGRFKRQYPMYAYELWTPERLHHLSGPRGRLGF